MSNFVGNDLKLCGKWLKIETSKFLRHEKYQLIDYLEVIKHEIFLTIIIFMMKYMYSYIFKLKPMIVMHLDIKQCIY